MCGIVGLLAYSEFEDKKMEKVRQESMIFLGSELLQLTQIRGKEATGIATLFADGDYMGLKMGVTAQEFVSRFNEKEHDYADYIKVWRKKSKPAKIMLGHCRQPSSGNVASPKDNKNNHPLKIGDIVGIHNGTINNHNKIFENLKCKRDGSVDSEAIFRLLHHYTKNGTEPFTKEIVQEVCKRLSGNYAVLAFSGNNPFQMVAFRDGKPIELAVIKPLKLVILASETDFIKSVLFKYNKMANLYQTNGTMFHPLKKGDVELVTLSDDSLFLFDIRQDITDDTDPKDLYITEKVPRIDKIWKDTRTSTVTNNWNNNDNWNNRNHDNAKKTNTLATVNAKPIETKPDTKDSVPWETNSRSTQTDTQDGKTRVGMAWNSKKKKYEYVSKSDIEEAEEHGNVEINCEDGEVTDAETLQIINHESKTELNLTEANGRLDVLQDKLVKIEEIPVKSDKSNLKLLDHLKETTRKVETSNDLKNIPHKVKEIDLDINPETIKKAEEATKIQPNFVSNNELMDAIEISDETLMKSMTIYSLANRIKSFFFKKGWYLGYNSRMEEERNFGAYDNKVKKEKQKEAQHTILNIKTVTKILGKLLGNSVNDAQIQIATKEILEKGGVVNSEVVKKVIKQGDLIEVPGLEKVLTSISKENINE